MQVNPTKAGFSATKLGQIERHLNENYITPGKISGCQVMVSRHGVPAYFQSFGHMDRERGKPVLDDTIFRIYSMTEADYLYRADDAV
jgi:CubicO group peptidase (beta-lactamase class C family)